MGVASETGFLFFKESHWKRRKNSDPLLWLAGFYLFWIWYKKLFQPFVSMRIINSFQHWSFFCVNSCFCPYFSSAQRIFFNISYSSGLLEMRLFSFSVFEKVFIYWYIFLLRIEFYIESFSLCFKDFSPLSFHIRCFQQEIYCFPNLRVSIDNVSFPSGCF